MLDIIGRRPQLLASVSGMVVTLCLIGGLIKGQQKTFCPSASGHMLTTFAVYGSSANESGIYGTIAVIFLFQGFYAFAITPLTALYPTEVAPYKLRATSIAIFRAFDSGFG